MPGCDNPIIQVEKASLQFGAVKAVREASLSVTAGSMFGLVGSDGAGKTSLLRMIATMIKPSSGAIFINSLDVLTHRKQIRDLIGYMPQRFGLYQDLTVEENFQFFIDIYGIKGQEAKRRRERYLGFSNLLPFTGRPAGQLSGGMKQKLGLACVLVHEPQVLILDEPTSGVDVQSRKMILDYLLALKSEGITVIYSSHILEEAEKVCSRFAVLDEGRLIAEGTLTDMLALNGGTGNLEQLFLKLTGRGTRD